METLDNTGLGLIGASIERVRNKESLFGSALKKLVNSTEPELDVFLKMKIVPKAKKMKIVPKANEVTLRLIPGGQDLSIKALDGRSLIYKAKDTFGSFIDLPFGYGDVNNPGLATPETHVQVHEIISSGKFIDIFRSLPGTWNQKWVSQSQVIEFCKSLAFWLRGEKYGTFFLIKTNENEDKLIDENDPYGDVAIVVVCVCWTGLAVHLNRLTHYNVWCGQNRYRVVSPIVSPKQLQSIVPAVV